KANFPPSSALRGDGAEFLNKNPLQKLCDTIRCHRYWRQDKSAPLYALKELPYQCVADNKILLESRWTRACKDFDIPNYFSRAEQWTAHSIVFYLTSKWEPST